MSICKDADLPEIIDYYNSTKGGVDRYDQMCATHTTEKHRDGHCSTVCVLWHAKSSLSEWLHHPSPQPDINGSDVTETRHVFVGIGRATNDSMDGNTVPNPKTPNTYKGSTCRSAREGISIQCSKSATFRLPRSKDPRTVSTFTSQHGDPSSVSSLDFRMQESCRTMPLVGYPFGTSPRQGTTDAYTPTVRRLENLADSFQLEDLPLSPPFPSSFDIDEIMQYSSELGQCTTCSKR
ncbi:hypothetical protein PR048_007594 [Dryococelus australis]|uniref:Uncharacterized protein n=1 Tax=Dryococelus australis TaxID=614101 RepID=A0ABQ9HUP0_9NEOP|nr:hypothetical protein PR048_007594 [Dryococelus australis]